ALPVARFNLTFNETGLSSGVWWTVQLNGYGYSSSGASLLVPNLYPCSAGSAGTYTVAVPTAYLNGTSGIRFVPSGYPTSICTTGTTQVTFTFTEQYLVTPVTTGGGTAAVQVNGVPQSTPAWVTKGTTAGIEAQPASGYAFSGWVGEGAGNYTGPALNDELTPSGPITEVASFALIIIPPLPTYNVDFHAGSGLVAGTPWMLTFNGTAYASTSAWINVSGLEVGSYSLTVPTVFSSDHLTEFVPTVATTSLRVVANLTDEAVAFTPSYYVSVHGTQGGTVVSPVSGWVASGKTVTLNATPNLGYLLVGWTGTGTGSYSGSVGVTTLTVTAPISEVATFAPVPAAAPANNGLGSNSTAILIGLAVVGLVIGLAVGYVAFRRGRGGAPPAEESTGGSS
ncbi:MAG: hypothetical protein L3K10_02800, partial [Thermoplasmata archaeon]|nr:hypothetical protein [Thermoplasmata archaeon]